MPRSPFELPDYPISLGSQYRLRPDGGNRWPQLAIITRIDGLHLEFEDVANGDLYETRTPDFREAYHPA
jgi:hypothetical protein